MEIKFINKYKTEEVKTLSVYLLFFGFFGLIGISVYFLGTPESIGNILTKNGSIPPERMREFNILRIISLAGGLILTINFIVFLFFVRQYTIFLNKLMDFLRTLSLFIKKNWLWIGLFFLFIYFLPYIILQNNSYIQIHDNLDDQFLHRVLHAKMTADSFNPSFIIDNMLSGVPIGSIASKISISQIFYLIFPPLFAFLANEFIIRLIGFIGMYLLLNKFIFNNKKNLVSFAISLIFMYLPIMSIFNLSTIGQPILLFSLLSIYHDKKNLVLHYLVIILFAFYSYLALSGIFIGFFFFIAMLILTIKNRSIPKRLLLGFILLVLSYIISEYQLFYLSFFNNNYISHRSDMTSIINPNFISQLNKTKDLLFSTQYHSAKFKTLWVIICFAITALIIGKSQNYRIKKVKIFIKSEIYILSTIFFILSFYLFFPLLLTLLNINSGFASEFQFVRFYFLLPVLWFLLFALSIKKLCFNKSYFFAFIFVFIQFFLVIQNNQLLKINLGIFVDKYVYHEDNETHITYNNFYDEILFNDIKNYIGLDQNKYRVVSLGIHPSISLYNGFYTLDGYLNNYPLEYKKKFREIISEELEKSEHWKEYFDSWGNRCYIFSSELDSFLIGKNSGTVINNLSIDTEKLSKLGGNYILSTVEIKNALNIKLKFEKFFDREDSYWGIYLYSVNL